MVIARLIAASSLLWTRVASLGLWSSTTIAGPSWKGEKPEDIEKVIQAETEVVGILGRTSLHGPEDVKNVAAIPSQYKLEPLSAFLKTPAPQPASTISFPAYDPASNDFLVYLNFLLQFARPTVPEETDLMARFTKIGIPPGKNGMLARPISHCLQPSTKAWRMPKLLWQKWRRRRLVPTVCLARDFLKNDYMTRAMGAEKGPVGNSIEEAWYGGFVGDGSKPTMLHFPAGQLPPAKFFWSLTLYTFPDRLLYANPLDRYSIGDRTKGLVYGEDKSLTIYPGHVSPGETRESNWLPTPEGKCSLVARVYGPEKAAIDGSWKLPKPEAAR